MGELYDSIAKKDLGVAKRWKARTKEDLTFELKPADVDFIMGPIFRGYSQITEKQGEALILVLEPSKMTREAVKRVRHYVDSADVLDRWKHVQLATDDELRKVTKALSNAVVGRIIFKSPGSGITYAPFQYDAVRRLIDEKRIAVFQSKSGGLSRAASARAYYNHVKNKLVFNEMNNPGDQINEIVHETTHAIQDWKDVRIRSLHSEADAFIAAAVSDQAAPNFRPSTDENNAVVEVAAKLVVDGKVGASNQAWLDAYENVAKLMANFYDDDITNFAEKGKVKERDIWQRVASAAETTQMLWDSIRKSSADLKNVLGEIDVARYGRK